QDELKRCGAVDFDDLLLFVDELFSKFPDLKKLEASRFDHLLVDEYQDTNGIQYNIVKGLAQEHRNICVVGDDDQSIYGFRGSEVEHILNFPKDWPGATEVRLEANYRSVASILELANTLIAFNKGRYDKVLRPARSGGKRPRIEQFKDEEQEAEEVVKSVAIQIARGEYSPRDIAILFRTNEQPRVFEQELRKQEIPYVILGSKSFFDRKEVKDILSYLRIAQNPHDEPSMRRIINSPPRGISNGTVNKLIEAATERGVAMWEVMQAQDVLMSLPVPVRDAIRNFSDLVLRGRQLFVDKIGPESLQSYLQMCRYEKEVERTSKDAEEKEARWASVEELVNAVGSFEHRQKTPTLDKFLDEIALAASDTEEDKDKQLDRDAVALLTLHASKGLEYPVVYMVGLEEGILPHKRALELDENAIAEERRLTYVGVTRAQDELTLSMSLTRRKWGRIYEQLPSRLRFEMIGQADNPNANNKKSALGSG
ncbi:MAG: 3'-5' exonuclease, partial [Planctomycetota bacterium]|nr:3'-5' exonuclease [Planctomycetota bacterium]